MPKVVINIPEPTGEYYCHIPGRGEPTRAHQSLKLAVAEAERLAKLQTKAVNVYRKVATVSPKITVQTETKYE